MLSFPKGFKFGWSQSGFQSEMGTPGSEDPNSDWHVWVHDRENIVSQVVSGDLPENGPGYWGNYKRFHDEAEKIGLNAVRINVEWSRIFPRPLPKPEMQTGTDKENSPVISVDLNESKLREMDNYANHEALSHYRQILEDLRNRGFHIVLNMYHWTLPIWLHDPIRVRRGDFTGPTGWLNSRTVYEFARFSAYVAWKLDDLASEYATMNEPNVVWGAGYAFPRAGFPPNYLSFRLSEIAKWNIIQAHARAYDAIKSVSKKSIGIRSESGFARTYLKR